MARKPEGDLRRGWTTGACATASTRAAYCALLTGAFPDPVSITLPRGERPSFALAVEGRGDGWAMAGIVKDAGDDPDVTHGALVTATVRLAPSGSGVRFRAGPGVGTVTLPGLPVPPGEPAINPVPRRMMSEQIAALASQHGGSGDVEIEIGIPGGETLAEKTWNPRLGIKGGLSILGTTGVVDPFSCSAWIHSIHRGVDVARAAGLGHVVGSTGSTSEATARTILGLPDIAMIDMGDFAGGLLKYLRAHPVPRVTIAGGIGKLTKLAQGHLDLHSGRSQVSFDGLADLVASLGGSTDLAARVRGANTALEALNMARGEDIPLADRIAEAARDEAQRVLGDAPVSVDVLLVDRQGGVIGRAGA